MIVSSSFILCVTKRNLRHGAHGTFSSSGLSYLLFAAKLSNANILWFQGESQKRNVVELMYIYFDFVTVGRTQSREFLNNLERNTQLSFLQSLVQVISLTAAHFIRGDCCHNVLIKANASLGTHIQSESNIPNSLDMLQQSWKNFTFFCAINIFPSANAFFSSVLRDVSAGSTDLLEPLRVFKATQGVGELLKGMWFNLDNLRWLN